MLGGLGQLKVGYGIDTAVRRLEKFNGAVACIGKLLHDGQAKSGAFALLVGYPPETIERANTFGWRQTESVVDHA